MYSYDEVIEKITHARRFGKQPGVEVTAEALEALGHPERGLPWIHVAGTNGKGSVCAFLDSILQMAGEKVGTFTSPHLITFEERITVNGERIPKEAVARIGGLLLNMDLGVELTMFDYCLLMAVFYFRECGCSMVVIETGLGGRLDATNALGTPDAAVITRIGLDHTAILGDTLAQIAAEKAGILKSGSMAVIGPQEPEAQAVLLKRAAQLGLYLTENEEENLQPHRNAVYQVGEDDVQQMRSFPLRMKGEYQYENAAIAKKAAEGLQIPAEIIRNGLERAFWPGRMQLLSERPFLLVDGAHNPNGAAALRCSLESLYPGERFHFLMGVMEDKDDTDMLQELLPLAIDFVTVTPHSARAKMAPELAEKIRGYGLPAAAAEDVETALRKLPCEGRTVAFGSLYFIGELCACFPPEEQAAADGIRSESCLLHA